MDLFQSFSIALICVVAAINATMPWQAAHPPIIKDAYSYGKTKTKKETFLNILSVPKRWFTYFYIWGVVWNASILIYILTNPTSDTIFHRCMGSLLSILYYPTDVSTILSAGRYDGYQYTCVILSLVLVCVQVVRRSYECLFITVFSSSQMHLAHFFFGVIFYTSLGPIALYQLIDYPANQNAPLTWSIRWYQVLAVLVFVWASYHQHQCHTILANLRSNSKQSNKRDDPTNKHVDPTYIVLENRVYRLPEGDWFRYCSSPHYLAEMLIYSSLIVVGWGNIKWLYALVTTINYLLTPSHNTHTWYKKHFKNKYQQKYALFPYIF